MGTAQFGGLEWREPHILLTLLDQSRSEDLSIGSSRGPDTGWARCHLDQQIVSTIPAQTFPAMEQCGCRRLWGEWDPFRAISKPVLACPHCAAVLTGQGKRVVKTGWIWCLTGSPQRVSTPLHVFIQDGETQVSRKIFGFVGLAGLRHDMWPEKTSLPRMCHCFFEIGVMCAHRSRAGLGVSNEKSSSRVMLSTWCGEVGCSAVC